MVNYHSGVLDGVAGRLGLTPRGIKEHTRSPSEGMLRRFLQDLEHSVNTDDSCKPMGWSLQGWLYTEYTSDFMQRNRGKIHCVFCHNLLPNLIRDLDALHLSEPASPPHPRERLDSEQLLEQFKEMRVEGRKTLFSTLINCAKGSLTAEERDQMANFIRPDPAPLPPAITTTAPVVTMAEAMPVNAVPQPTVTTFSASLPATTTAVVVTAAVTPNTTTSAVVAMTTAPPVTSVSSVASVIPVSIMPHEGTGSSVQQTLAPVVEVTGAATTVTASGASFTPQMPSGVAIFPPFPSVPGTFSSAPQG